MKNTPKTHVILSLLSIILLVSACGKQDLKIGKNNPDQEIKKCVELSQKKKFEEAIECLEIFKSRFPQTDYSTQAELAIGDNYFDQKEYLLAADAYLMFVKMHPTSPRNDYAYYRLGLSYLKESPKAIDRDQQYLDDSIRYLRVAVSTYPSSEYHEAAVSSLKDARARVAKRIFYIARFYYKTGEYKAAIPRYLELVRVYPESELVPEALYKLVLATGKLKYIDDAKLFFSKLTMDYPNSEWTKKAESKMTSFVKKYGSGRPSPLASQQQNMETPQ